MNTPISRLKAIIQNFRALYRYPPGHFYSPLSDTKEVAKRKEETSVKGIDLRAASQKELLEKFVVYYQEQPFSHSQNNQFRYTFSNPFFCESDGLMLYAMLRHLNPVNVVEIGSGYSSAVMLDTAENYNLSTKFTFVEPYPERLYSVIKESDKEKTEILEKGVQNIDFNKFKNLKENDILFIDSSHVAKYESDVNYLFFEVLPTLNKGVVIHIHDIFFPFDYPYEWIKRGRAWNEGYLLKAFLQFNSVFQIELFNDYIIHKEKNWVSENMSICLQNTGGSIWLRKVQ